MKIASPGFKGSFYGFMDLRSNPIDSTLLIARTGRLFSIWIATRLPLDRAFLIATRLPLDYRTKHATLQALLATYKSPKHRNEKK